MSGVFIVSTSSASMEYREMSKPKMGKDNKLAAVPRVQRACVINGGANIAPGAGIITPKGVATKISDVDYEWLKEDPSFLRHVKNGYMKVIEKGKEPDANAVAGSMKEHDGSAPQNVDSGNAKPSTAAAE